MMFFTGKIKATETIERERTQLWSDFQTYLKIEGSDKLKNYLACKEKVDSKSFQEHKREIELLKFNGSPEEKMVKEYNSLEKNSKLKLYFGMKSSVDLDRYRTIVKSGALDRLKELDQLVNSSRYRHLVKDLKHKKNPDEATKKELVRLDSEKKEYENLKTSDEIRFHNRFIKSKGFRVFNQVEGSSLLDQYTKLKQEIESEKFVERKNYLEDKKRYEKTNDFKTFTTFQTLGADPEIKLYIKYHNADSFKFFREWQPTFKEEFDNKMHKDKWSFISPIAEKGPGKNFAIKNQLHNSSNEDNFHVEGSILTLETKQQTKEGLYWDEQFGFVQKPFNYTSGLAHTLNYFKQEYGFFEIKVKASKVKGVISSVSLVDEEENHCVRLFNSNAGLIQGGLITTDHMQKKFQSINFSCPSRGYVIVSLNWTPEKLEWTVNDKIAGVITHNVPHIPLGIRFESEVVRETGNLPHRLDIDWIKCYKRI